MFKNFSFGGNVFSSLIHLMDFAKSEEKKVIWESD